MNLLNSFDDYSSREYTKTTYEAAYAKYVSADDVFFNENATQEEINTAYTELQKAIDNLYSVDNDDVKEVSFVGSVYSSFDENGRLKKVFTPYEYDDNGKETVVYPTLDINGYYRVGQTITLTAVDVENATFGYWTVGKYNMEEAFALDGPKYYEKTYTFTVEASDKTNMEIAAFYKENTSSTEDKKTDSTTDSNQGTTTSTTNKKAPETGVSGKK